jgi:serine phosphatase RsbU (regulator of sigma subunit)
MSKHFLDYFAPPAVDASEAGLEAARSHRMRRSLRVFCGISAAIALIRLLNAMEERQAGAHGWAALVELCGLAAVYVYASPARRGDARRWAAASLATVAAISVLWMSAARVDRSSLGPGTGAIWWQHFLASLVITWTWREATVAALVMVGANLAFKVGDLALRADGMTDLVLGVALAPLAAGPGVALCWYFNSKFRRRHVLTTESGLYRSLAREMEGARRIHEASMPREIDAGGVRLHYVYQPYRQIGGDLLFVYPKSPREGEAFTLVVLDVAGHGIAAALTVNRVVGEIERLVAERARVGGGELGPSQLAEGLNRYVRLTLSPHALFATAFIARVEPEEGRVRWVNCGHPTSFMVGPGGSIRRLDSEAMMLGVCGEEEMGAEEREEAFPPGAVLLACTDGATEARAPGGEALRTEGFARLVADVSRGQPGTSDWAGEIARRVAAHRAGPADDDTLVVAVCREGSATVRAYREAASEVSVGEELTV